MGHAPSEPDCMFIQQAIQSYDAINSQYISVSVLC